MAPAPALPIEIVEKILSPLWKSRLSSTERITLMTACPLLGRIWKAQFARMASTFIYIPRLSYLLYLAKIVYTGKSHIYDKWDLQNHAQTITCFLHAAHKVPPYRDWDWKTLEMYHIFTFMGNYVALRTCFPSVRRLHLESLFYYAPGIPDLTQPNYPHQHWLCTLTWTRIAIVFDEGPSHSAPKELPSTLTSYRTQFDVDIILLGSPPDLELQYWEILECVMIPLHLASLVRGITVGLCLPWWSKRRTSIRQLDSDTTYFFKYDIPQKLFESRKRHSTGVGFSFQCDAIFEEHWVKEDIMGVQIRLWRAGRKQILDWDSICMELWRCLCGRNLASVHWKRPYHWIWVMCDPPAETTNA